MADLYSLVTGLMEDGTVARLAANPRAQFGIAARQYLGATLLPERTVDENAFREDAVKYRTVIANDGTRYSPAQKKGNELVGSFLVELAHQDIANEMTGRAYDILVKLLGQGGSPEAVAQIVDFVDRVNLGLVEKSELQRWQAIVNASVPLTGDNGYSETVAYSNPANHRAAAGGSWSSDAYDPFTDIYAMADLLTGKGYTVNRIITSRTVLTILANNDKVKARAGMPLVQVNGTIAAGTMRASQEAINNAMAADGLPAIETYDLQYRTQTGTGYFLARDAFVMLATTGRDESLDLGDSEPAVMTDTLGYTAIGRAVGQAAPGRAMFMQAYTNKPPRIEVEAWQTSLPVILEPESIAVINTIS